jgi:dihydrolipoamide dehydrogenase
MNKIKAQVLVVGAGPGGYVAAIRCGQLGLDTVLVEADRLGGTCLIRGCIPSKALIHVAERFHLIQRASERPSIGIHLEGKPFIDMAEAVLWKNEIVQRLSEGVQSLLTRAKVRVVKGWGKFSDAKACLIEGTEGQVHVTAEHVILATGSIPAELSALNFGGRVISSTEALALQELPKRLLVVGAGYIGLELGTALRKLGVEVTIVEAQSQILPAYDAQLVEPVARWLRKNNVKVHTGSRAIGFDEAGRSVGLQDAEGQTRSVPADYVLVTVGRTPLTSGWGLEEMGLEMSGAFVLVDDRCATSTQNVWAIGDLVGEPMLAHKASAQAEMVAENIAGRRRHFDPVAIPAVCFTDPEIVIVGKARAVTDHENNIVAVFPLKANGRASTLQADSDDGFVRIVASRLDHRVLGVQAVGQNVSELSGEFTHALEMGSRLEDIAGTIHAHPSLGEAFHEAALKALNTALHF